VAIVTAGFGGEYGVLHEPRDVSLGYIEKERLSGWLDALEAAKITPLVIRLPHADPQDVGHSAAEVLLTQRDRPTAILCFSDAIARGVIGALHENGLHVPEDVSVVGFDDNPVGRRTQPALTTVRQNADAKGRTAAAALITAIKRAKTRPPARGRHIVLPTELVIRASTARAPTPRRRG